MSFPDFEAVRKYRRLLDAWGVVSASGKRSEAAETRAAVHDFEKELSRNLRRMQSQLQREKFNFGKARGIAVEREGKSPRPIITASVEARIVQRAILEHLQGLDSTLPYRQNPVSFGSVPGKDKGRGAAIRELRKIVEQSNSQYFIRSDIAQFFTRIPRQDAIAKLGNGLDEKFVSLLDQACNMELENAEELHRHAHLFPTDELGAPQGLCLSPLMGNVVLHEFDSEMNGRGIRCLRYVDDFLLIGNSESAVKKAFASAQCHLGGLEMTAYDPSDGSGKAECGLTRDGLTFLGYEIHPGQVHPTGKAKQSVIGKVQAVLRRGENALKDPSRATKSSLQAVLYEIACIIKGWQGSYAECDDDRVFAQIDQKIKEDVDAFWNALLMRYRTASAADQFHLLGVPLLADLCTRRKAVTGS
jgi:retron-type reverse transcriptase